MQADSLQVGDGWKKGQDNTTALESLLLTTNTTSRNKGKIEIFLYEFELYRLNWTIQIIISVKILT